MKVLYAGCDLHGNNNLIGIVDGEGKRVFKKKLSNDVTLRNRCQVLTIDTMDFILI